MPAELSKNTKNGLAWCDARRHERADWTIDQHWDQLHHEVTGTSDGRRLCKPGRTASSVRRTLQCVMTTSTLQGACSIRARETEPRHQRAAHPSRCL